jgi:cell division ATPase FtsA
MNIYRFEVTITEFKTEANREAKPETKSVGVVIAAKDDESAFTQAEIEVEKHYLKLPTIKEMVLLEKKKVGKAGGYVLDETVY